MKQSISGYRAPVERIVQRKWEDFLLRKSEGTKAEKPIKIVVAVRRHMEKHIVY